MYSESDLRDAVAAGAISAEAAQALRAHVSAARAAPVTDEENFRLVTSFNDIFVTIAAALLLGAMGGIGNAIAPGVAGVLVAGASWAMAEFFTLKRRMALPSIVLLLSFVGGIGAAGIELIDDAASISDQVKTLLVAGVGVAAAAGAWFHWRRFHVPITVAAGAAAVAGTAIALILGMIGPRPGNVEMNFLLPLVFVAGLAVFAYAMRWDISDRARETRRADVAFWLHLLAAPMIAHPLFYWLGVTQGENIGGASAAGVLVIYVAMALVALAVDRRALLVSALAYVLIALTWLFDTFGAVELNVALTALVIGSALLTLSAFWTPIRNFLVGRLPGELQARLPVPGGLPRPA